MAKIAPGVMIEDPPRVEYCEGESFKMKSIVVKGGCTGTTYYDWSNNSCDGSGGDFADCNTGALSSGSNNFSLEADVQTCPCVNVNKDEITVIATTDATTASFTATPTCGAPNTAVITLSVNSPQAGYFYSWAPQEQLTEFTGPTVESIVLDDGSYTFYLYAINLNNNENGCCTIDEETVNFNCRLQNSEETDGASDKEERSLKIYPNPANQSITIRLEGDPVESQKAIILIRDGFGRIQHKLNVDYEPALTFHVNLPSSMNDGIYHAEFVFKEGSASSSFIKSH